MVHSKRRHGGDAAPDRSPPHEASGFSPKWLTQSPRSRSIRKCRISTSADPHVKIGTRALACSSTRSGSSRSQDDTPALKRKSSRFRGVTKHRVTSRFEAHLWDKDAYNDKQKKWGRQVYLGAYTEEDKAAQAYDLAALKYWGPGTLLNFELEDYAEQLKVMAKIPRGEYLASLRRKSSGFSRGESKYRGVAKHHHNGRWEARIGRVEGNKYLYLGTFSTQEEAAVAYDLAAIKYRGRSTPTNFDVSRYPNIVQDNQAKKGSKNNTSKRRFKQKCRKTPPTTSEDEASSIDSQTTKSEPTMTNNDEEALLDDAQTSHINEDIWTTLKQPEFDQEHLLMDLLDPKSEEYNVDIQFSIPKRNSANPYYVEEEDNNYTSLIVVPMPHIDDDLFLI